MIFAAPYIIATAGPAVVELSTAVIEKKADEEFLRAFKSYEKSKKNMVKALVKKLEILEVSLGLLSEGLKAATVSNGKIITTLEIVQSEKSAVVAKSLETENLLKVAIKKLKKEVVSLKKSHLPQEPLKFNARLDDFIRQGKELATQIQAYEKLEGILKEETEEKLLWKSRYTTLFKHVEASRETAEQVNVAAVNDMNPSSGVSI